MTEDVAGTVGHLTRVAEPAHQVLSHLIHHCAPDPATRTTLSAALVMSMWQLRHRQMSEHVPSTILLNAAEAAPDPVDDFVETLIQDEHANRPGESGHRFGIPIQREDAPSIMARAIQERRGLGSQPANDRYSQRDARLHEEHYREAQKAAFGSGWARCYSKAWVERFGLLTDSDDGIILRLNEGADRAGFRRDVLENPDRLLTPTGIGRNLEKVIKTISVSGSLTVELWDEELVTGIIKLGLPVLFLPHHAREPMAVGNPHALKALPQLWRGSDSGRVQTSLATPPIDWFDSHAMDARRRLRHLPGQGAYEFGILQVLHQLGGVCHQIAYHSGNNPAAKPEDVIALFWDLHARAFRGVTLGVAALAWHCLGFDPGCPRDRALKVLNHIRSEGPVTLSDLLFVRGARLDAATRDVLLERLIAEDLIRIERKTVTAVTFAGFVAALLSRPALPEAADFRTLVAGSANAHA